MIYCVTNFCTFVGNGHSLVCCVCIIKGYTCLIWCESLDCRRFCCQVTGNTGFYMRNPRLCCQTAIAVHIIYSKAYLTGYWCITSINIHITSYFTEICIPACKPVSITIRHCWRFCCFSIFHVLRTGNKHIFFFCIFIIEIYFITGDLFCINFYIQ